MLSGGKGRVHLGINGLNKFGNKIGIGKIGILEFRNIQNTKIIFKMYFDDTYLIYNMKTSPILGSKEVISQNSLHTIKK